MTLSPLSRSLYFLYLLAVPRSFFPNQLFVDGAALVNISRPWSGANDCRDEGHSRAGEYLPVLPVEVDVIIDGGGLSGLMAAYKLQQNGFKTVLLEAKDALGGKSGSQGLRSGPGIIELGATWINNSTQPEVFALTQKFELKTIVQCTDGDTIFQGVDGTVQRNSANGESNTDDSEFAKLQSKLMTVIETAAAKLDIHKWDDFQLDQDVSFADWIAQKGFWNDPHLQGLCRGLTTAIVGQEPEDIGAHYFLDYIKSSGTLQNLMSQDKSGAQFLWIKQGTTAIANSLAGSMTPRSVLINTPVKSITQQNDHSIATTETGKSFKAKKIILAITQNVYGNIKFSTPLPYEKDKLVSYAKPGIFAKIVFAYSEPWWRDAGLVGQITSLTGPICYGWEISDPSQSLYTLALFVTGEIATRWHALPEYQREQVIINHLAILVGKDLATSAYNVLEVNYAEWTKESYIMGGPTSSLGPGILRKYGTALREPFGSLHFAGTESAFKWKGYMEGAITAGQRAAEEVVEALDTKNKEE